MTKSRSEITSFESCRRNRETRVLYMDYKIVRKLENARQSLSCNPLGLAVLAST